MLFRSFPDNEKFEYKPSEDEIRLRQSLLASEKNKEKNKEKKEDEKKGEDNEEDKENEEDEDENENESKEEHNAKIKKNTKLTIEESTFNEDAQSSATSGNTGSTMRSFYSLRAAIDEKYVPKSIRNMSFFADLVFLLILCIAILYFCIQISLYNNIKENIENINFSNQRLQHLLDITHNLVALMMYSEDDNNPLNRCFSQVEPEGSEARIIHIRENLKYHANKLETIQSHINLKSTQLSERVSEIVNPINITLKLMNGTRSEDVV